MATKINMMSYKDLTELKMGIAKSGHTQFLDLIDTCANFVCQRTGRVVGPIDALGTDWMVAVDSASGLNIMAMELMMDVVLPEPGGPVRRVLVPARPDDWRSNCVGGGTTGGTDGTMGLSFS